jgi:hypothetical protein
MCAVLAQVPFDQYSDQPPLRHPRLKLTPRDPLLPKDMTETCRFPGHRQSSFEGHRRWEPRRASFTQLQTKEPCGIFQLMKISRIGKPGNYHNSCVRK